MVCEPCLARALRAWLLVLPAAALAQPAPPAQGVYTCLDDKGRRLSSDRPIPECVQREQRLLNRDGSLRMVLPPPQTPEERLEADAQARRQAEARAAQADAVRRDRNLVQRYPDEASHRRAREAALETARSAARQGEQRLAQLAEERRPLERELEFYRGKPVPQKLLSQIESVDAATRSQRVVVQGQKSELDRIQRMFDEELARLRLLWAGQIVPGAPMPLRPASGPVSSAASAAWPARAAASAVPRAPANAASGAAPARRASVALPSGPAASAPALRRTLP